MRVMKMESAVIVCAVMLAFVATGCSPGAKITEDSKTKECKQEIVGALNAFARDSGLDYQASVSDADAVFATGEVAKSYGRDGFRYTCTFGLEQTAEGCNVKFFKRSKRGPGESRTTSGNYGTVKLNVCKCAK